MKATEGKVAHVHDESFVQVSKYTPQPCRLWHLRCSHGNQSRDFGLGWNKDLSTNLQVTGSHHQAVRQSGEEDAAEDMSLVRTTQAIDCFQVHTLQHGTAPFSGTASAFSH